jgi:hypothetical protein
VAPTPLGIVLSQQHSQVRIEELKFLSVSFLNQWLILVILALRRQRSGVSWFKANLGK